MNYKFLLHDPEGKPPFIGWDTIPPITNEDIASISDSVIKSTSGKIGSSIPTPLARLFTFQNAFAIVNRQLEAGLDNEEIKNSIYGGVVSDCLDFLEWIFHQGFDNFEQININLSHENEFGETANMLALSKAFDNTVNNYFDKDLRITLFKHKTTGKIVGGTSPFSLLYTSPNWRREIKRMDGYEDLRGLGTDVFFDNEYCLLEGRDIRFISYLESIVEPILMSNDNNHSLKHFADYISNTLNRFPELETDVSNLTYKKTQTFSTSDYFEFNLKQIDIDEKDIIQSDFHLANSLSHVLGGKKPIVLSSTSNLPGQYVAGIQWEKKGIINFDANHSIDLNERRLPKLGKDNESGRYPYIIDSDLFQKKLIEVSYDINNDFFFTIESETYGSRFLLPLKPLFFEIFKFDLETFSNQLIIEETGQILRVKLSIPINGTNNRYQQREIEFIKEYNINAGSEDADIIPAPFEFAFFPFYRKTDVELSNNHKKIVLWLEKTNVENKISDILFYDNHLDIIGDAESFNPYTGRGLGDSNNELSGNFPLTPHRRMEYEDENYRTNYFSTDKDYRLIEIRVDGIAGVLFPKFIEKSSPRNRKFKYAIDFGTSNTHIEYAQVHQNGNIIENTRSAFSIPMSRNVPQLPDDRPLVVLMHEHSDNLGDLDKVYPVLMREFMPTSIGNSDNEYNIKFPARSVILDFKDPESADDKAFLHSNIAFKMGEKDDYHPSAIYTPDLKWLLEGSNIAGEGRFKHRIRMFFEQLFFLIKFKALMDDCEENNLTICFTRPMSMAGTPLNDKLQTIIKEAIKDVFSTDPNDTNHFIFDLDESLAPYEYNKVNFINDNFCNIDIGGGTTDILFAYRKNRAGVLKYHYYLSSFRFAGNDLWGNDVDPQRHNGMLRFFNQVAGEKAKGLSSEHPFAIGYEQYMMYFNKGLSDAELISILFKNDKVLNFSDTVFSCLDFKLILFIHYASLLYYVNHIYQKEDNDLSYETTISLSGNGSRYLKQIKVSGITSLLLKVFSNSTENCIDKVLEVENPKEITAKGALSMMPVIESSSSSDDLNMFEETGGEVLTSLNEHLISKQALISDEMVGNLTDSLDSFFEVILNLLKSNSKLKEAVGDITPYENLFSKRSYNAYIQKWLNSETPNLNEVDAVFFKPIKYLLFELSQEIYEKNKIN